MSRQQGVIRKCLDILRFPPLSRGNTQIENQASIELHKIFNLAMTRTKSNQLLACSRPTANKNHPKPTHSFPAIPNNIAMPLNPWFWSTGSRDLPTSVLCHLHPFSDAPSRRDLTRLSSWTVVIALHPRIRQRPKNAGACESTVVQVSLWFIVAYYHNNRI